MQRKDRSGRAFFHPHSQSPVDINILKLITEGLDRNNFLQIMMVEGMNKMTCLHSAIQHVQTDAIKLILEKIHVDLRHKLLNVKDTEGERPLGKLIRVMQASDDQQKEVIRLVLGLLDIERRLEIAENMLLITYHSKNSGLI